MPTLYLEINALQSPFSIGNDTAKRAQLSFNILAKVSETSLTFEEDICKLIQNAGLATLGTNMWYGSLAPLSDITPTDPAAFVTVLPTGGLSPLQTHNSNNLLRPSAQIITRALGYVVARNKANAIHAVLNGKHNVTVTL